MPASRLLERRGHVTRRLLLKLPQLDVGDAAAEVVRADGLHPDLLADDVEVLRLGHPSRTTVIVTFGAGLAAHALGPPSGSCMSS